MNTTPAMLFRLRDSIYASDFFIAALCWLDFFTWLAKNPSTKEGIREGLGIAERPSDVLLTLLSAMGYLKKENDLYYITELAEDFLIEGAPYDLRPYFSSLKERPICKDALNVLKTDKPMGWGSKEKEWKIAMEQEDFVKAFTSAMDSRGLYLAPDLAQNMDCTNYHRILDIAGGSGIYTCAVVKENSHMEGAVLEKPPVDQKARQYINQRGLANRVDIRASDMFKEELPTGFDIHLYSHALHDWNEKTVKELIKRSYHTLLPGGMIAIYDMHVNETKTGPLPVAEYSALLLYSTEGKCYSIQEISDYLKDAGFIEVNVKHSLVNRSLITGKKPNQ